jgi:hypothetical protein
MQSFGVLLSVIGAAAASASDRADCSTVMRTLCPVTAALLGTDDSALTPPCTACTARQAAKLQQAGCGATQVAQYCSDPSGISQPYRIGDLASPAGAITALAGGLGPSTTNQSWFAATQTAPGCAPTNFPDGHGIGCGAAIAGGQQPPCGNGSATYIDPFTGEADHLNGLSLRFDSVGMATVFAACEDSQCYYDLQCNSMPTMYENNVLTLTNFSSCSWCPSHDCVPTGSQPRAVGSIFNLSSQLRYDPVERTFLWPRVGGDNFFLRDLSGLCTRDPVAKIEQWDATRQTLSATMTTNHSTTIESMFATSGTVPSLITVASPEVPARTETPAVFAGNDTQIITQWDMSGPIPKLGVSMTADDLKLYPASDRVSKFWDEIRGQIDIPAATIAAAFDPLLNQFFCSTSRFVCLEECYLREDPNTGHWTCGSTRPATPQARGKACVNGELTSTIYQWNAETVPMELLGAYTLPPLTRAASTSTSAMNVTLQVEQIAIDSGRQRLFTLVSELSRGATDLSPNQQQRTRERSVRVWDLQQNPSRIVIADNITDSVEPALAYDEERHLLYTTSNIVGVGFGLQQWNASSVPAVRLSWTPIAQPKDDDGNPVDTLTKLLSYSTQTKQLFVAAGHPATDTGAPAIVMNVSVWDTNSVPPSSSAFLNSKGAFLDNHDGSFLTTASDDLRMVEMWRV